MTTPTYRYYLTRALDDIAVSGRLGWVMLNPSTADESVDDPTIRKVKGFTLRAGYREAHVANLYPLRATSPKDLHAADEATRLGRPAMQADDAITRLCRDCDAVVVAWGAHGGRLKPRVKQVARLLVAAGTPVMALLGQTKNEQPRHPLMAAYSTPIVHVDDWLYEKAFPFPAKEPA